MHCEYVHFCNVNSEFYKLYIEGPRIDVEDMIVLRTCDERTLVDASYTFSHAKYVRFVMLLCNALTMVVHLYNNDMLFTVNYYTLKGCVHALA